MVDRMFHSITSVGVVYHVTIVAIGHGLSKKFWPMVISFVLRVKKNRGTFFVHRKRERSTRVPLFETMHISLLR